MEWFLGHIYLHFSMLKFGLSAYLCNMYMSIQGGKKRVLNPSEMKLQTVVSNQLQLEI